jgi:hypothetical protein
MTVIWGKQDIGALATEHSFTNTRTHSYTSGGLIDENSQHLYQLNKKTKPQQPKSANSTHLAECMAQSRRETLKYTRGTLSDSQRVLERLSGRFTRSIATISFFFRISEKGYLLAGLTILQTIPWDVTLIRWYIYLGLYPQSGVPIRHLSRKLWSSPKFECIVLL